jgi:dihydrofolate synthase/folylpolyglutamate synthase
MLIVKESPEIEKLYSLQKFGVKLGLDNIREFLEKLGNPQRSFKTFHVAGSNGKGSTSSFIASILMEAGYKTGLYTSPHFVRFNERIIFQGNYIPDEYVINFVQKQWDYIIEKQLTFFEVTTAIAFCYFKDKGAEYAVIETGLGGRLDATNVLQPLAVVITSISYEHTNVLGSTLTQITGEKAAIIKKGAKVFAGKIPNEALDVVEAKCSECNCEFFLLSDYIIEKRDTIELYTEELNIEHLDSPLRGGYQRRNAALALLAVNETLDFINPHILEHGIKNVVKNTKIQGRFEVARKNPTLIFDSAHNFEGMDNFIHEFKKIQQDFSKSKILFTALKDKSIRNMLNRLAPVFDEVYITTLAIERALSIPELQKICDELEIKVTVIEDSTKFVQEFIKTGNEKECLVVTGSMYLVGHVKENLQ